MITNYPNTFSVKACPADFEVNRFIEMNQGFDSDLENPLGDFTFHSWALDELDLPDEHYLLNAVRQVEKESGLQAWRVRDMEVEYYRGFSLTYNKDYIDPQRSVYHQTWGDYRTLSAFSKQESHNLGSNLKGKNTYYDTYGFRHIKDIILQNFQPLFDKINGAILRSRVAYLYSENNVFHPKAAWHIDENQHHMLRLVIPVKTSKNFVLEIDGKDDYDNSIKERMHLPLGNAYVWNNRIPHRVVPLEKIPEEDPRIHIVVGFSPWFNYYQDSDCFIKNENHGISISEILQNKLFIKK